MAGNQIAKTKYSQVDYAFDLPNIIHSETPMTAGRERVREIRRRRSRKRKTANILQRVKKGTMEKAEAARKLRRMTPGADVIIAREGLK